MKMEELNQLLWKLLEEKTAKDELVKLDGYLQCIANIAEPDSILELRRKCKENSRLLCIIGIDTSTFSQLKEKQKEIYYSSIKAIEKAVENYGYKF